MLTERRSITKLSWLSLCHLLGIIVAAAIVVAITHDMASAVRAQEHGGYADSFELTGLVDRSRRFTMAELQASPSWTMTAAFGAGQGFQQGRFTGVPLWDLLTDAGLQFNASKSNDKLRKYVVVTGSDGYDAVFSLAELDPEFGAEVVLVAYARDGQPLGPSEGMARLVINTDKRGGRLVSNVVRIEVRDVDSPPRGTGS